MKTILQRVKSASVTVDDKITGKIDKGILILLGIAKDDEEKNIKLLIEKICNLRIFPTDKHKHFDKSILDIKGEILIISQFTLYANCSKGRRPSFENSAIADKAETLYNKFVEEFKKKGLKIQTGKFGALMDVKLTNFGPATFILEN